MRYRVSGYVAVVLTVLLFSCNKLVKDITECAAAPFGANFEWTAAPASVPPLRVEFRYTSTASSGLRYQWEFGDGSTGSGGTVTHIYQTRGVFRVTLSVTGDVDGETCTKTQHKDLDLSQ
ncbi:MAG: PKD domain-containing protein [Cytophagales bacterium]|nr:PKD domain-containing protein [Cytophagales bacterium]